MAEEMYKQVSIGLLVALISALVSWIGIDKNIDTFYIFVGIVLLLLIAVIFYKYGQIGDNTKKINSLESSIKTKEELDELRHQLIKHEEWIKMLKNKKGSMDVGQVILIILMFVILFYFILQ